MELERVEFIFEWEFLKERLVFFFHLLFRLNDVNKPIWTIDNGRSFSTKMIDRPFSLSLARSAFSFVDDIFI